MALIGTKGLMVLELPKRWGKNSEFEGGKSTVNCRWVRPQAVNDILVLPPFLDSLSSLGAEQIRKTLVVLRL